MEQHIELSQRLATLIEVRAELDALIELETASLRGMQENRARLDAQIATASAQLDDMLCPEDYAA